MSYSANPTEKQAPLMLDEALRYAARGWPIFPCRPDKRPLTANSFKDASTDAAIIESWWTQWPDALIAAPTGEAIGAWVLDIDDAAAFHSLANEFAIPATRSSRTGRGMHLYFAWDADEPVRNRLKCDELPGADIRGEGGYVILPPSLHPSGKRYEWERDEDASEAPSELVAIARRESSSGISKARELYLVDNSLFEPLAVETLDMPPMSEAARLATISTPRGARSEAVYAFVAQAIREGWPDDDIGGVLLHADNAISERIRECGDPSREITRAIAAARCDEQIANGEIADIRTWPVIDFTALIANGIAKAHAKVANDNGDAHPIISATPFVWKAPADIPLRPWVYGRWLLRNTVTAIVAPGGVGKSSLIAAASLSLVTGKAFLGQQVWGGPKRVWVWNLEDDQDELDRQFAATAIRHGISPEDAGDRLFVDSGPEGAQLCIASDGKDGFKIYEPVIDALVAELRRRRIDVLKVDPFVSSHRIDENDNGKIDAIAKRWAYVAKRANCAIVLVHHSRKLNGTRATADLSRGASSLGNACRSVLTLNPMENSEATSWGIPAMDAKSYFSVENDKSNRSKRGQSSWFHITGVDLGNGGLIPGDEVGAVESWSPPNALEGVTNTDLARVQDVVAGGDWRENIQARDWVGKAIADALGLDLSDTADKARARELARRWIADGSLKVVQRKDAKSELRPFVEVGKRAEPKASDGA